MREIVVIFALFQPKTAIGPIIWWIFSTRQNLFLSSAPKNTRIGPIHANEGAKHNFSAASRSTLQSVICRRIWSKKSLWDSRAQPRSLLGEKSLQLFDDLVRGSEDMAIPSIQMYTRYNLKYYASQT